jgi:hypothetical protein
MQKLKFGSRSRMPAVPEELIWEQRFEGFSQLSLTACTEHIENMQSYWFYLHRVQVYPLRVDGDTAEYVVTMKIDNGVKGWLFAELHAETATLTRIQGEAGVDSEFKLHFTLIGFIASVLALITLVNNLILGTIAITLFVILFWYAAKEVFKQQLLNEFKRAVGLVPSNG